MYDSFSSGLIFQIYSNMIMQKWLSIDSTKIKDPLVKYMHAISSLFKNQISFECVDHILEMRDLCGGHGYSEYSRLPYLLRGMIVQTTWEGSNNVLIQQTAKYLLQEFVKIQMKNKTSC